MHELGSHICERFTFKTSPLFLTVFHKFLLALFGLSLLLGDFCLALLLLFTLTPQELLPLNSDANESFFEIFKVDILRCGGCVA